MKIITSDEILRKYVPNVFVTVAGEPSFFEKLHPFLLSAETWAERNIVGNATLIAIAAMEQERTERELLSSMIVSEAFRQAVPSLDLVLTPNGFGIVNNTNVVPASAERITRLVASLEASRDDAISSLLPLMAQLPDWQSSAQSEFFRSSLFPTPSMLASLGYKENLWRNYLDVREQLILIEDAIAESWLSPEYMATLRSYGLMEATAPQQDVMMLQRARRAVITKMKSQRMPVALLSSMVDYIIDHPSEFPVWHESSTAELFNPPVFENKKENHGYFF